MNLTNGILLCSNHHKLFDKSLITITTDYRMTVKSDAHIRSEADEAMIRLVEGKQILLPDNAAHHPKFP